MTDTPAAYVAEKCPCGHQACKAWHVSGVAQVQGVYFTERQARAVADLLNEMDRHDQDAEASHRDAQEYGEQMAREHREQGLEPWS